MSRPDGTPDLDLSRHHFVSPFRDLAVIGTWVWNDDMEADEPCLVIVPRYRKSGFKPAVVALSATFQYTSGQYLASAAWKFVRGLGMEETLSNAYKVGEAIDHHLLDLLKMPPSPTEAIVVGEAGITSGGTRKLVQVLDHVPVKQA